jgi:prepilin-type N-terminal cleavage/methylation domain-containing protein
MKKRKKGFTLIELLVVVAIIALLISILLPSLSRAREMSKRLVCGANLKGLGTSFKIYANDNDELWPVPAFDSSEVNGSPDDGKTGIEYVGQWAGNADLERYEISKDEYHPDNDPSTALSTTRAFWMLVRTGDVTVKQYWCPSSDDVVDDTNEIDRYYDFKSVERVSYGYQVPYGPGDTRPSENADTRIAMAADKGPFNPANGRDPNLNDFDDYDTLTPASRWKRLNSGNHGGRGSGEGQNILFQDGHADFERKPIVGVDQDNIYTLMSDNATELGRLIGEEPGTSSEWGSVNPYPGEGTFDEDRATSDSLIFP